MQKLRELIRGAGFAFDGIRIFYQTPQLWKYAVFPLLLILLTYTGLMFGGWFVMKHIAAFFAEKSSSLPGFLQWLATVASGVSAVAMVFILSVIAVISLGTLYELFGGLFFDALIQRFSVTMQPPGPEKPDWKFNLQGIFDSIIYSINTLLIIIAACILNLFLPFIGQILSAILISYRFGVAYMAVSGFHYKKTMLQTRELAYRNCMATLGYGLTVYIIFLFPLAIVFTLPGLILGGVKLYNEFSAADNINGK